MTFTTEQGMASLAKDLELAASLLRTNGLRALVTTHNWIPGPGSPNLDPNSRSWRWEVITHVDGSNETVAVPADPTGEAILTSDELAVYHGHLRAALTFIEDSVDQVIRIVRLACPNPASLKLDIGEMTPAQVSAAGWCTSCFRDDGYLNSVAVRPNGQRRYRDSCDWCGKWSAAHDGTQPPLVLVQARRAGKRITERMAADALAAMEAERRETKKKNRKKTRARRKAA